MAMKQPSKVLDGRLCNFLEKYESALSDAIDQVSERFSEKIEPLIEEFGAPAVAAVLRYHTVTVRLPNSLDDAFGPIEPDQWRDEE